jgi:ADP-heptose:LPS heptosyltransferase
LPEPNSAAGRAGKLRQEIERISSLLVIRIRSLGDSILALPMLEALHAWRPDLRIDVLVEDPYDTVFFRQPAVHEILVLKSRQSPPQKGWARWRACREIRRRRYDAILNLHGGSTSFFFTAASGARLRIGQEKYRHARCYHALIPSPFEVWQSRDLHTVHDQLTFLRWLEIPIPAIPSGKLILEDGARDRMRSRLASSGIAAPGYLVIHATATLPSKQWPAAKFGELADRLFEQHGLPVIFTAGPREGQVLLDIGRHTRHRHRYWSDLALDSLFALIEGCRLFIGNDSGPTHAAAALGKRIVVVWGSSDFRVWHPWETEYEAVRRSLPCMPCPGYACAAFGRPRCIEEIPVADVFDACSRMLGNRE